MDRVWHHAGDAGLRGGYLWREDALEDHVRMVAVVPCGLPGGPAGAPCNLFRVESGYLHVSEDDEIRAKALAPFGIDPARATRADLVEAFRAWGALDVEEETLVRLGPADPGRSAGHPEPDVVLPADACLRAWVEAEHLAPARALEAA